MEIIGAIFAIWTSIIACGVVVWAVQMIGWLIFQIVGAALAAVDWLADQSRGGRRAKRQ